MGGRRLRSSLQEIPATFQLRSLEACTLWCGELRSLISLACAALSDSTEMAPMVGVPQGDAARCPQPTVLLRRSMQCENRLARGQRTDAFHTALTPVQACPEKAP